MKASLNWILEFVSVQATPQEIADRLTLAGLEIEGMTVQSRGLERVVTAKLLKVERHPNADRLTYCEARTGTQTHSIVCGAKNHKVGDMVALALPGARLPNGAEIQETVIRKVKSGGMLCSEKELGFAAESEGILILPPETPEGVLLAEALGLNDVILEVNVTPNRGDCLSMRGLAREVAAAFEIPFTGARRAVPLRLGRAMAGQFRVQLQALDLCPRYSCRLVRGVKVGPAPVWAQRRLEACGVRSINNVVDATNYVMLETGQPLHAFDLNQVKKGQLLIRRAQRDESLITLDGKERPLQEDDLVIADGERVLALAGVMGGGGSGVEATTADLLLESAYFVPDAVRKTAKRAALQTESSYRFERGVDPNGCVDALNRLAELIVDWAGGEASADFIDLYPKPAAPLDLTLSQRSLDRVLGYRVALAEILPRLQSLGLEVERASVDSCALKIPTFRSDLSREIDLVEEAARLHGYHRIPVKYPSLPLDQQPFPETRPFDRIRQILTGWGFSEVIHYSFTSPQLLRRFRFEPSEATALRNPISEDLSVLRPSLIPQMAETLRQNVYRGNKDLKLFELRPVYLPDAKSQPPFAERWRLCLGCSGSRRPLHFLEKAEGVSLVDLKGYLNVFLNWRTEGSWQEVAADKSFAHPHRQLEWKWVSTVVAGPVEGDLAAFAGELHPGLLEEWGIRVPMAVAEIDVDLFLTDLKKPVKFREISSFPSIGRDLNLVVDEEVSYGTLRELIRAHGGALLGRVEFFDLYRGKPLPEGKKAMTFTLEYGSSERTLTDEEVNRAREALLEKLKVHIGATLR